MDVVMDEIKITKDIDSVPDFFEFMKKADEVRICDHCTKLTFLSEGEFYNCKIKNYSEFSKSFFATVNFFEKPYLIECWIDSTLKPVPVLNAGLMQHTLHIANIYQQVGF